MKTTEPVEQKSPNNFLELGENAVELLKNLISIPSYSKEEDKTADLIEKYLQEKGVQTNREKNNIWAFNHNFSPEKPTILLNSHHDTVRPNSGYTLDPFTPIVKDGKLYGLGSNDAGGALVSLMAAFLSFSGFIRRIDDFWTSAEGPSGCYKIVTVQNSNGDIVNFIVSPETYIVDFVLLRTGDSVTGFYDANAPVPMIYPPQYRAVVMARNSKYRNVKVDFFNNQLISSDGMLKLNLTPFTPILLENGQAFTGNPANRDLIVVYGPTTKSIPAQTTPYKVIVMCR